MLTFLIVMAVLLPALAAGCIVADHLLPLIPPLARWVERRAEEME